MVVNVLVIWWLYMWLLVGGWYLVVVVEIWWLWLLFGGYGCYLVVVVVFLGGGW